MKLGCRYCGFATWTVEVPEHTTGWDWVCPEHGDLLEEVGKPFKRAVIGIDGRRIGTVLEDDGFDDGDNITGQLTVEIAGPSYNHTRADGPFDPCPKCLSEMSSQALRELVEDLAERNENLKTDLEKQREGFEDWGEELRGITKALGWEQKVGWVKGVIAAEVERLKKRGSECAACKSNYDLPLLDEMGRRADYLLISLRKTAESASPLQLDAFGYLKTLISHLKQVTERKETP